jgi:hypothetical protein
MSGARSFETWSPDRRSVARFYSNDGARWDVAIYGDGGEQRLQSKRGVTKAYGEKWAAGMLAARSKPRAGRNGLFGFLTEKKTTYQRDVKGERADLVRAAKAQRAAAKRSEAERKQTQREIQDEYSYKMGARHKRENKPAKPGESFLTAPASALGREKAHKLASRAYMQGYRQNPVGNPTEWPRAYPTKAAAESAWYDSAPGRNDRARYVKRRDGWHIVEGQDNPKNPAAASGPQYRLAVLVASGKVRGPMPLSVAREIVASTPDALKREFSKKNPGGAYPRESHVGERWEYSYRGKKKGVWRDLFATSTIVKDNGATVTFADGRTVPAEALVRSRNPIGPVKGMAPEGTTAAIRKLAARLGVSFARAASLFEASGGSVQKAAALHKSTQKQNPAGLFDSIRPGSRVTIVNRFGQKQSGRAVMRGPAGWVLNLGGKHGTPGIASPENVVAVSKQKAPVSAGQAYIAGRGNPITHVSFTVDKRGRPVAYSIRMPPLGQYQPVRMNLEQAKLLVSTGQAKAVPYRSSAADRRAAAKNPRKPAGRRNPLSAAARLSERFHGRPATEVETVREKVHSHGDLTKLGDLVRIVIDTVTGFKAELNFDTEDPLKIVRLGCSEDGKQLYLRGGDQEVNLKALRMDSPRWIRDRMELGRLHEFPEGEDEGSIVYRTKKKFNNFRITDWWHKAGEVSSKKIGPAARPTLVYDPRSKLLELVGGRYVVQAPGIID